MVGDPTELLLENHYKSPKAMPSPTEKPKKETTKMSKPAKATPDWIVNYNLISGSLWGFVLVNTILTTLVYWQPDMFHLTSTWTTLIQCFALVEIYNSAVGNVRSPLMTTVMQVASRLLLVLGIFQALPYSPANFHWTYFTLSVAWSVTEIIRYYYYAINLMTDGNPPDTLKWLRYNSFIILYPMGISSECAMIYMSLEEAEYVFGPVYKYFLVFCLLTYIPGSYTLFTYMLKQRKKVMKQLNEKEKNN